MLDGTSARRWEDNAQAEVTQLTEKFRRAVATSEGGHSSSAFGRAGGRAEGSKGEREREGVVEEWVACDEVAHVQFDPARPAVFALITPDRAFTFRTATASDAQARLSPLSLSLSLSLFLLLFSCPFSLSLPASSISCLLFPCCSLHASPFPPTLSLSLLVSPSPCLSPLPAPLSRSQPPR
eukprot:2221496-Rhodomonas_salina.1